MPSSRYYVRATNTSGSLIGDIYDFHTLSYTKQVNVPGLAAIVFSSNHSIVPFLENNCKLEIYRRPPDEHGVGWYRDFLGIFRAQERTYDNQQLYTAICTDPIDFLRRRIIAWTKDYTNRSLFSSTSAEYIMKTLVDYNIGPSATAGSGRIRAGTIDSITVQTNGNNGNTLNWECAWRNLLGEVQAIARVGGGDFDVVPSSTAGQYRFEWFTGQRGTDRTGSVRFALEHGNMGNPLYRLNNLPETTVAIVGGQGETSNRTTVTRTGANYATNNDIETFVDGRSYTSTTALNVAGDTRLDATRTRHEFSFNILETPASPYGVGYCVNGVMGDLVTARYEGLQVTQKITRVTVEVMEDGNETINVETQTA